MTSPMPDWQSAVERLQRAEEEERRAAAPSPRWRVGVLVVTALAIGLLFAGRPNIWPLEEPVFRMVFTAEVAVAATALYLACFAFQRKKTLWAIALCVVAVSFWNPFLALVEAASWGYTLREMTVLLPRADDFARSVIAAIVLAGAAVVFARPTRP